MCGLKLALPPSVSKPDLKVLFLLSAGLSFAACQNSSPQLSVSMQQVREGQCEFLDRTGGLGVEDRTDALALRLAAMDSCPTTFKEAIEVLVSDEQPEGFEPCTALETRVVETQAQHLQAAGNAGLLSDEQEEARMAFGGHVPELGGYHTVTSVQCGGNGAEERVLFLQSRQFQEAPTTRDGDVIDLPENAQWEQDGLRKAFEAIAWDPKAEQDGVSGVFNYYAVEPEDDRDAPAEGDLPCAGFGPCKEMQWAFHGNSKQYLDLDDQLEPTGDFAKQERRCAICHTGGGLIMRELNAPWINWEEDFFTPGATDLVQNHGDSLGRHLRNNGGANQEFTVVNQGNALWDEHRIAIVKDSEQTKTPATMLKPLFCSVELNLQSGRSQSFRRVNGDFFVDRSLGRGPSIRFDGDEYQKAIQCDDGADGPMFSGTCTKPVGQIIPALTFGAEASAKGPAVPAFGIIDTAGSFLVPERSGADMNYIAKLEQEGLIDDELVEAVLGGDFTTPILSKRRCDVLLELDLSWDDFDGSIDSSSQVREVVEAKLEEMSENDSISVGAAELLANLKGEGTAMSERIQAFSDACEARADADSQALMNDVLHMANVYREKGYQEPIFKFIPTSMPVGLPAELLPAGTSRPKNARFDPKTCELTVLEEVVSTKKGDGVAPPSEAELLKAVEEFMNTASNEELSKATGTSSEALLKAVKSARPFKLAEFADLQDINGIGKTRQKRIVDFVKSLQE